MDVSFDARRWRQQKMARVQAGLRRSGLAAALLFDPNNVRYSASIGVAVVENLHVPSRWLLLPAEGQPILWEYGDAFHLAADRYDGSVRRAHGWTFFGSGSNSWQKREGLRSRDRGCSRHPRAPGRTPGSGPNERGRVPCTSRQWYPPRGCAGRDRRSAGCQDAR